jgi:hypothetical protein
MPSSPRRFPPPWTVEENDACFVVSDANGQKLAYVYYESEPRAPIKVKGFHRVQNAYAEAAHLLDHSHRLGRHRCVVALWSCAHEGVP